MAKSIKGKDIAEIVADSRGYTKKHTNFNIGDWYGFINDKNEILRIKYISSPDIKGNYNVYQKELEENAKLIAVLRIEDTYKIIVIKEFSSSPIIINEDLSKSQNDKSIQIEDEEFISDNTIYKISQINNTVDGICQRAEHAVDVDAIKKLLHNNNTCSYCGATQEQINEIDKKEKLKQEKSEDYQESYGLTSRTRGKKLEVDQIDPKRGYVEGNITLCCYWCNNAKTDTFSAQEFKEIARGINIAWNMKIKQIGSTETICFPENSAIWKP